MDASAINAPFLLSKLANHNRQSNGDDPATPLTEAQRDLDRAPAEGGAATPSPGHQQQHQQQPAGNGGGLAVAEEKQGPPAFDAVFTNAALHWVRAPRTVIEGAKRVLRPGGRYICNIHAMRCVWLFVLHVWFA